jgi:hypothetical protein
VSGAGADIVKTDKALGIRHSANAARPRRRSDRVMRRRDFISLLGGAAAAWPLTARAQQAERVRRVGVLMTGAETDPEQGGRVAAFWEAFEKLRWADGRNVRIDVRYDVVDPERMRSYVTALLGPLEPAVRLTTRPR